MAVSSPLLIDVGSNDLTDVENDIARMLSQRLLQQRQLLEVLESYYDGEQRIEDLGISVPPVMAHLRTVTGWPRLVVDVLDERLDVLGFRYPKSTTADSDIWDIWQANCLDEESQLAHLDALIFGRSFVMVGSNAEKGAAPLITVESPLNMASRWDARTRAVTEALQVYAMDGEDAATLFTQTDTVTLVKKGGGSWEVTNRDTHRLGFCPVVMVANRQRSNDRYGRSEITPEVRSVTDAACRTLLGLEGAREFYAIPQRWALNVTEEAFKNPDGTQGSGWEAAMSKVWAIPPNNSGDDPIQVGQFTPMSPAVYTEIVDLYARTMSSMTGMPPAFLGMTTQNPASADAIRSSEARLNKRAQRRQGQFSGGWEAAIRIALAFTNGGKIPTDALGIETIWADTQTPTPAATSIAMLQQVQAGFMPASSRVALEQLGYTPLEIERIESDRAKDAGLAILAELSQELQYKEARADTAVAADLGVKAAPAAPTVIPKPTPVPVAPPAKP